MPRYIAFLRAINVGGHVVKMDRLALLFESLGLAKVETFIASGNVIFESRAKAATLEAQIEQLLERELGYAVKTFVRTDAEVAAIADYQPFDEPSASPDATLFIGFLAAGNLAGAEARLHAVGSTVDDFHLHRRELYWRCRVRSSDSQFSGAKLEKLLGVPTTIRNANTVRRLVAKYPPRT